MTRYFRHLPILGTVEESLDHCEASGLGTPALVRCNNAVVGMAELVDEAQRMEARARHLAATAEVMRP